MQIIVTGGAGFIGSHIVDGYIARGHKVAVIDNLLTGFRKNLNPKAKFYKADIRDQSMMEKIFRSERPEIVNHHAAIAEVVKSLRDPLPTFETNFFGTLNILLAFAKYGKGKKRFIFSSTGGAIYGEPKRIPANEDTPPAPLSPYGLSKLLDEEIIKFYSRSYNFDYLIFRYPNVYGPRQNPKGEAGVIAIWSGLMKNNGQPVIFGDGTKSRDYTYVGDIVRANVLALRRGKNTILNLGWGKPVSDLDVFTALAKEIGFKKKPVYAPYRQGEVYQIAIDARRAKQILGWQPKIKLEEGIRKTVATI